MNNLLIDLGLERRADGELLAARLGDASEATRAVLSVPSRRTHYERVHLQFEALAVAKSLFELAGTRDDHRWNERCVEFESAALPGDGCMIETE